MAVWRNGEGSSDDSSRIRDGLIEVAYDDGKKILLQTADIQHHAINIGGVEISYQGLCSVYGYEYHPYTLFSKEMALLDFGDSLEAAHTYKNKLGIFSKRHVTERKFLSIVESLQDIEPSEGLERLKTIVAGVAWQDTKNYPVDFEYLTEERELDLWVRLEQRHYRADGMAKAIIAKMVTLEVAEDKETMIPLIENYDGSQAVPIPRSLKFGKPWLYVGENEYT